MLPFSILLVFPDGSVKTDRKEKRQKGTTYCEGDETTHKSFKRIFIYRLIV